MKGEFLLKTSGYILKAIRFLSVLFIVVIGTWLFKSYLFSVYYIPSNSMSPSLSPGDYVLVSKFPYSLRSPEYFPLTAIPFPSYSISGGGEVKQGDIIVFDLPLFPAKLHPTRKENYIKRAVGLPGDTVLVYDDGYYLQKNHQFNSGRLQKEFLVLSIPRKGTWIQLADSTKKFWESILLRDGTSMTYDSLSNVIVNGKQIEKYRVKQNYYFLRGDHTRFSSDSRSWGLVPETNLIGRAEMKLWPWPLKGL